jgi:hypothetical protein
MSRAITVALLAAALASAPLPQVQMEYANPHRRPMRKMHPKRDLGGPEARAKTKAQKDARKKQRGK